MAHVTNEAGGGSGAARASVTVRFAPVSLKRAVAISGALCSRRRWRAAWPKGLSGARASPPNQPDQGGREQAALGCRLRRRGLGGDGHDAPLLRGVPRHARRRGLGRRQRGGAEVRLPVRPRRAVDRRAQGSRLPRLRDQLPDRPRPRRHPRSSQGPTSRRAARSGRPRSAPPAP